MKIIINGVKIKTDKYAGNFEREITAYCTGHIGDCEVGDSERDEYLRHFSNEMDNVDSIPDENGCYRPVILDSNCDNLIIVFEDDYKITEDDIHHIKLRVKEYGDMNKIKILGIEYGTYIL